MKIALNGEWSFCEKNSDKWMKATVPGCNYLDLLDNGKICDPFVGVNEKDVYWVAERDWIYRKNFDVDKTLLACDEIFLECMQLDTVCELWLNSKIIGKGNNCHIKHEFSIKSYLNEGNNELIILFYSPVNYVKAKQKLEKCPRNNNGQTGIPHIRKPQCHFGWDWGPVLPPSGISGEIQVVGYNMGKITNFSVTQEHYDNFVDIIINGDAISFGNEVLKWRVTVDTPTAEKYSKEGEGEIKCTFNIPNPQLWYPKELSDKDRQPLYNICVYLIHNGVTVDEKSKRIGLRTILLNRERDEYGQNFQFIVNGTPIFVKGANWIPADSFITRFDEEKLRNLLLTAQFSHMNMLRIWGGGYYERDIMYDLCDEYGILLWQDFCFACQPYPFFDGEFLTNVKMEVEFNVKRLKDHPSLAVWAGNNEIEAMSINWLTRTEYVKWTEKFFYEILPEEIRKFDKITPYIEGTPCGVGHNHGHDCDNVGDTHLWAVWHGLQPLDYYRKRMTRFCSEFGFESLPDIKTVKTYAQPKDYSLNSEVFKSHQKCAGGNGKMAYYITSKYRLPAKFEDYIYLSQLCQQECIKDATEHWRRNKGRCNGSMYWQFNDCWQVCSWASVDYNGNYKALQYTARHFFNPVALSIEDGKNSLKVYAINDTLKAINGKIVLKLVGFEGQIYFESKIDSVINPNSVSVVEEYNYKALNEYADLKTCVFVARLEIDGRTVNQKTILFEREKKLSLPKTDINMQVRIDGKKSIITLSSNSYARMVKVESKTNSLPFSDNYFDLIPNEPVTISQSLDREYTLDELKKEYSLFSYVDVVCKGSRLGDLWEKTKIFFVPINFFSWLYMRKIPSDIRINKIK